MIAEDLINQMIPPLKASDDAHKAIVWMEEFRCNHMPVVENGWLLGFISEEIILETNDIEKKLMTNQTFITVENRFVPNSTVQKIKKSRIFVLAFHDCKSYQIMFKIGLHPI